MDVYNYKTSPLDIIRLWFKKKRCSKCGGKVGSFTYKELKREGVTRINNSISYGKEYTAEVKYKCKDCGEVYSCDDFLKK